MLDHTHQAQASSWVESANLPHSMFSVQHLPLARAQGRVVAGIGDKVVDITAIAHRQALPVTGLKEGSLLGLAVPAARRELRYWLFEQLTSSSSWLANHPQFLEPQPSLLLPFDVGDYTDFYASIHHATRVGSMFRPENPLLPNYPWIPIGYHGRTSSLVVSGTDIVRPYGQLKSQEQQAPEFGACRMLDYELEVGFWVGRGNALGDTIPIAAAREHWIGISLLNDWSARDMQRWEYQPLGPFLAKSFATSVSPWVTTQEALIPFMVEAAPHQPPPLDYLWDEVDQSRGALDLHLQVQLRSSAMLEAQTLSQSNSRDLFWTPAQMLTHHASNGCPLRTGDLFASGTISGEATGSAGCLLELTWVAPGQPRRPVDLNDGSSRIFLEDGDEVILQGWAHRSGFRSLGLGSCRGRVVAKG